MNIRLHHKIALTINFFRALGVKDYNSVVAIIREGDGGIIRSTNLSEQFVKEFRETARKAEAIR